MPKIKIWCITYAPPYVEATLKMKTPQGTRNSFPFERCNKIEVYSRITAHRTMMFAIN